MHSGKRYVMSDIEKYLHTFDLRNLFSPQSYSTTTMQHNAGLNLRNHITFDVSTSLDSWPEI